MLDIDELILTRGDPKLITHIKTSLVKNFEMVDLEILHLVFNIQVLKTKECIYISQPKHTCDLVFHFHMDNCKLAPSPF